MQTVPHSCLQSVSIKFSFDHQYSCLTALFSIVSNENSEIISRKILMRQIHIS